MTKLTLSLTCVASVLVGSSAMAQSNVDVPNGVSHPLANKYCWGENLGWINWGDANARQQGATMSSRFLSGYIWAENAGWINLGTPLFWTGPSDPYQYPAVGAQTGASFGVNIDTVTGTLSGYAWGENTGWVYFGAWPQATAGQVARIARTGGVLSGRLNGYAWSENAGWINLDVAAAGQYVSFCYPNCDGSTSTPVLNVNDFQCFLNAFAAGNLCSNCDGSTSNPVLNVNDFQCFLNQFAAGCS